MLIDNVLIIDRMRADQVLRKRVNYNRNGGTNSLIELLGSQLAMFLGFIAIHELDGSYTVLKNRFTGKREYHSKEELEKDIAPYVKTVANIEEESTLSSI